MGFFYGSTKNPPDLSEHILFARMKSDRTYDLHNPFMLLSDPETPQDKFMTHPDADPTPTKWQCYNCGKNCFDKAERPYDPKDFAAWCPNCAHICNDKSGSALGTKADIDHLLAKNGMCSVRIDTAKKANPTVSDNPNIKVEVGQVWSNSVWNIKATITKVANGYAEAEGNSQWGKLTPEGCPVSTWDREWKLTFNPQEKLRMKVGQVWKLLTVPNTTYTIAEIKNGRCSVIRKIDDKAATLYDDFGNDDPSTWGRDWYLYQNIDLKKTKPAVGQTWSLHGGSYRKITRIEGNSVYCDNAGYPFGYLSSEGYPDRWSGWELIKIELPPAATVKVGELPKPKVGQKWKWISNNLSPDLKGKIFTIERIENGFCHTTAGRRGIAINEDGTVPSHIYNHWELVEDIKEESKGMNSNDDLLLKKLEAIHNGCADNHGYGYHFYSEMANLGYFQHGALPSHRSVSTRLTVQGRAKMEELQMVRLNPHPTTAPPKIGQVWKVGNITYRIAQIPPDFHNSKPNCIVMEIQRSDGTWNSGHSWTWSNGKFIDGMGAEWILISAPPTIKVGQSWRNGSRIYKIISLNSETNPTEAKLKSRHIDDETGASLMDGSWSITNGVFNNLGAGWTLEQGVAETGAAETDATPSNTRPATSIRQMLKGDAVSASYRVAAYQLTKGTKKAILSLMEKQGHGADRISALTSLLDTEVGSSLVGMLLGMGLTYMPPLTTNGRAQRLATEFRVGSMVIAGNAAADIVMEHFIPTILGALSSLPKENVRVVDVKSIKNDDQFELPSHEDSKKEAQA